MPFMDYIALGAAGLGMVFSISALAVSLRGSPKAKELSEEMARETKELREQNQKYWNAIKRLNQDMASMAESQKALEGRLVELERKPQRPEEKPPVPAPAPAPAAPPLPKTVGRLKLDYNMINPRASYLVEDPKGDYDLLEDGTVIPQIAGSGKYNTFKNWANTGLMYLFELEMQGTVYTGETAAPAGYYRATGVAARARVDKNTDGVYKLSRRGRLTAGQ